DHLLVIAAVALWASRHAPAYRGRVSGLFLATLLGGTVLAATLGTSLNLESMVLSSVVLAGGLLLAGKRFGLMAALPLIAVFGGLHGYVHGQELAGHPAAFVAGMLLATAAIQGSVFALSHTLRTYWVKSAGAATALSGLLALIGG
ncbi:MAG: protein hupE, partial [Gammaproteobacteria bacterium]